MNMKHTLTVEQIDKTSSCIICENELRLVIQNRMDYYCLTCVSETKGVRALELMDFLMGEYGLEEGDAVHAEGRVSAVILNGLMTEAGFDSAVAYFRASINRYFEETMEIDTLSGENLIDGMELYQKKAVPWAMVKSLDLTQKGEKMIIRSLENTIGIEITADENVYIMIGCRGEVYDIRKDKFECSYQLLDEELDLYEAMLEFIPTVELVPGGECISLDEKAKICYPKPGKRIYAKELETRAKVYGNNNRKEYFLGRKGDYLAIREDDQTDGYIIKRDIFFDTYELAQDVEETTKNETTKE